MSKLESVMTFGFVTAKIPMMHKSTNGYGTVETSRLSDVHMCSLSEQRELKTGKLERRPAQADGKPGLFRRQLVRLMQFFSRSEDQGTGFVYDLPNGSYEVGSSLIDVESVADYDMYEHLKISESDIKAILAEIEKRGPDFQKALLKDLLQRFANGLKEDLREAVLDIHRISRKS